MEQSARKILIEKITDEYSEIFSFDERTKARVQTELEGLGDSELMQEGSHIEEYYQEILNAVHAGMVQVVQVKEKNDKESSQSLDKILNF